MPESAPQGSMSLAQMVAMARAAVKPMVIIAVTVARVGAGDDQAVTKPTRRRDLIVDSDVRIRCRTGFPVAVISDYVSTRSSSLRARSCCCL